MAPACSGSSFQAETANISGNYSVTLTDQANGCMFAGNWTPGASAQNVPVAIQQQGTSATATVSGVAALLLDLVLGTAMFSGSVQGQSFSLIAIGSTALKEGVCEYTIRATLAGTIDGDAIQGTITYSETTNGSPTCTYHSTCTSVQTFAGVRAGDGG
jgi:hypothetical protein